MNGRRAVVGLCMLCALLVSAFAAQGAAASNGTTAFTCRSDAPKLDRNGAHCLAGPPENFGHVEIKPETTTTVIATNAKTKNSTTEAELTRLKMTIAGVATELTSTVLDGEGWVENKVDPDGEHYVTAHGGLTYTNVEVAKPAGFGCKVFTSNEDTTKGEERIVHTTDLEGTTTKEGHNAEIKPTTAGGQFAHFIINGCGPPVEALNGPYTVSGSVTCPITGATVSCTHAGTTAANTLKVNGSIKAGIEGALTLKEKTSETPLTATTVETK